MITRVLRTQTKRIPPNKTEQFQKKSHLILSCPDFGLNANFLQPFSLSVERNSSCPVCAVSRSRLQFARQVTKNILKKRKTRIVALIHSRLYFSELPWLQVESIWNLNRTSEDNWKVRIPAFRLVSFIRFISFAMSLLPNNLPRNEITPNDWSYTF